MEQTIIKCADGYSDLDAWLAENSCRCVMLVCDDSIGFMDGFREHLDSLKKSGLSVIRFTGFQSNPLYENVVDGVGIFREKGCDSILAVGGGSALDVAKCIKLFANMEGSGEDGSFLKQQADPAGIPFTAMPTTAGTGSEATRYSVIYYEGAKQSITSDAIIPDAVIMDPSVLKTLPLYQKKATMMDAFCHALESYWSVNSNAESMGYSSRALGMILENMDGYLDNTDQGNEGMMTAAHIAGKAINITQTTAGHAMCYKITSLFGVAHGHAAILCDRVLFPWMIRNTDRCTDPRGEEYLKDVFGRMAASMGAGTPEEAADKVRQIFDRLELEVPAATEEQFEILKNSVNPVRLKNHPITLDIGTIDTLYHEILDEDR